jgi:hypothetical protein
MSETLCPGTWHMVWAEDRPTVCDEANNVVATVHGNSPELMLARAGFIAATPELFDTVATTLMVFRVMAEHGDENTALAAADMIPVLQSALDGASFLGAITPEVLNGP